MKYKLGDKVRVKTWDRLKREFGIKGDVIQTHLKFYEYLKDTCGEVATIVRIESDFEISLKFENDSISKDFMAFGIDEIVPLDDAIFLHLNNGKLL